MKKVLILLALLLVCVGCTRIDNVEDLNVIVDTVLNGEEKKANETSLGYKYYLPVGLRKVTDKDYNQKFKMNNNFIYLYADIVSFHYQNKLNFKEEDQEVYYYREIDNNGKTGYVIIEEQTNGKYYIKIIYNYAKIESYVEKAQINKVLANSMIILDSIDYNEIIIKNIIEEEYSVGTDKEYEIDKPNDAESKFSEYLSEYVEQEESVPELPEY